MSGNGLIEIMLTTPDQGLTEKQRQLLQTFRDLIKKYAINIHIDKPLPTDLKEPLSCDVEHDECGAFVCCGLYVPSLNSYFGYTDTGALLRNWRPSFQLIAHNGMGDIECLRQWGMGVKDEQLVHDTMLVGHILDSSLKSYGLKDMAKRELNFIYPSYDEIVGKKGLKAVRITLDQQPLELVSKYNACDVWATWKLYESQKKQIIRYV